MSARERLDTARAILSPSLEHLASGAIEEALVCAASLMLSRERRAAGRPAHPYDDDARDAAELAVALLQIESAVAELRALARELGPGSQR